jgi:hypothetical protein
MSTFPRPAAVILCLGVLVLGVAAFGPACLPTSSPPGDADKRPSLAEGVALRERLNQQQGRSTAATRPSGAWRPRSSPDGAAWRRPSSSLGC